MSREIKFRGMHNGEFIFGHYVTDGDGYCAILYPCPDDEDRMMNMQVLPETVGQFTGIYANGAETYEGDIISDHIGVGEVVWCDKNCAFKVSYRGENKGTGKWFQDYLDSEFATIEIIGNIHENKGLLK
ncbi:YopX family protein [bacterium]|nr:YopX family protein [bacterium]